MFWVLVPAASSLQARDKEVTSAVLGCVSRRRLGSKHAEQPVSQLVEDGYFWRGTCSYDRRLNVSDWLPPRLLHTEGPPCDSDDLSQVGVADDSVATLVSPHSAAINRLTVPVNHAC